jgi:hypothetical protein
MLHIRRSFLALIILLAIFFNVGRFHIGDDRPVELVNFVYLLGFIVVLAHITVPALRRAPILLILFFWIGIYILCKLTIFYRAADPLLGDFHTYISLTEGGFIGLTVLLTRYFENDIRDFEQAVENITLADAGERLRSLDNAAKEIQREVMRSRRYRRALSVIIVQPDPNSIRANLHRTVQEVMQTLIRRYIITSLGRVISHALRRTDIVIEQSEKERYIILCPEIDAVASKELIERIQSVAAESLGVQVMCGVSSFPDGRTFNELVSKAEASLQYPTQVPDLTIMSDLESQKEV